MPQPEQRHRRILWPFRRIPGRRLWVVKRPTSLRIHRRKAVTEPPLSESGRSSPAASDPKPPVALLMSTEAAVGVAQHSSRTCRIGRLQEEGRDYAHSQPGAMGAARIRAGARVRSAPRFVTPTVDRARRRAGACRRSLSARCPLADARQTPAPRATLVPQRPLITPACRRSGQLTTCNAAPNDASGACHLLSLPSRLHPLPRFDSYRQCPCTDPFFQRHSARSPGRGGGPARWLGCGLAVAQSGIDAARGN